MDERFPVNPVGDLIRVFNSWILENMGIPYYLNIFLLPSTFLPEALLNILGFPLFINQYIILTTFSVIGIFFFYLFLKNFIFQGIRNNYVKTLFSLLVSVNLVFNFATLIYYWFDATPYGQFGIALTAMLVYYASKVLSDFNSGTLHKKDLYLLIFASGLAFSPNIPLNVSLFIIAFTLPMIALISQNSVKIRKVVLFYFTYFVIVLTTNFWWYSSSIITSTQLTSSTIPGNLYTFSFDSQSLTYENVMRGMYLYFFGRLNLSPTAGWYALTKYIYLMDRDYLYLVPLIIVTSLVTSLYFFIPKHKGSLSRLHKAFFASVVIYLILFLLVMGNNSPILPLYLVIFRIPVLSLIFRDPAWTFGESYYLYFILVYSLSILVLYRSLKYIMNKRNSGGLFIQKLKKSKFLVPVSIFIVILLIAPVFMENNAFYDGNTFPSTPYKDKFIPPAFDIETVDYLESRTVNNYAILIPGGFQSLNTANGYDSFDYIDSMLPNNLIISQSNNNMTNLVRSTIESGDSYLYKDFSTLLSSLDIKYIVIEGDMISGPFELNVPDYQKVLASLNNTRGIRLAEIFPPNYIYEVEGSSSIVSSVGNYISQESLEPEFTIPLVNITESFFNSSIIKSSNNPLILNNMTLNNGEIDISLNSSVRNYFYNITGKRNYDFAYGDKLVLPTFMNEIPLNINTTESPYLILKFKTNVNAAFSVDLITANNMSTGFYSTNVERDEFQAGYSFSNIKSDLYIVNHYTSPDKFTTLVVNMEGELNYFKSLGYNISGTVNYIAIRVYPLKDNGESYLNSTETVPGILNWPKYQNITI
ncbi:MAG: hypothetical protein QXO75_10035, partial [Nitrososphaerota archaeon]